MLPSRPNILHFVVDQHHARMLGCADPTVLTPHADQLAREGVRCLNHYTQNPICTPSRISFLSGQYCHNHGYYALNGPTPTFPSYIHHFKNHGYRTAAIGKLHLPNNPRHWLEDHCELIADTMHGLHGEPSPYNRYLREQGVAELDDHRAFQERKAPRHWDARPSRLPLEHCVEAWITRQARAFLDTLKADEPFCMHLAYPRPHHVITPDQRFWDMYPEDLGPAPALNVNIDHRPPNFRELARQCREELTWDFEPKTFEAAARRAWRGTLALATQNDFFLGELLEHLRQAGRYENTVIVFTSDHGLYHGHYGLMEKAPGICSDAICRVPSIWKLPGDVGGRTVSGFIEHVDTPSTFCALAGLPDLETSDGVDASPLLKGQVDQVKEMAVTEWPWSKALRWRQWRFVHYHRRMYQGEDFGELYDIEADPWETRNLYHEPEHQALVAECRRRLLEWQTESTRITTAWPYLPEDQPAFKCKTPFQLGADGREPKHKGPAARLRAGESGAFNPQDYL
jgi:arylsulfatase